MKRLLLAVCAALLPASVSAQQIVMSVPLVGQDAGLQTIEANAASGAVAITDAVSFYGLTVTLTAGQGPGFILIWDDTVLPGSGATTAKRCWYVDAGARTTTLSAGYPLALTKGLVWGFSVAANCQTFTPAVANFVGISYKQQRKY